VVRPSAGFGAKALKVEAGGEGRGGRGRGGAEALTVEEAGEFAGAGRALRR
jgi:hypothetical protein